MTATLSKADQSAFEAILAGAVAAGVTSQNIDVLKACAGAVSIETLRTMAAGFVKPVGSRGGPKGIVYETFEYKEDSKAFTKGDKSAPRKGDIGHKFTMRGLFGMNFTRELMGVIIRDVEDGTVAKLLVNHPQVK